MSRPRDYFAAERVTAYEWVAFGAIALTVVFVIGGLIASAVFAIRVLKGI